MGNETLLITRSEVNELLPMKECIEAVEQIFRLRALGKVRPPGILAVHSDDGGFHTKAGVMQTGTPYYVGKTNANFPMNPKRNGLPTIQGIVMVSHAGDGRLLALMDSMEITVIRTGAATAVAAKYLARPDATTMTICGCGNQGRVSLKAISEVRKIEKVFAVDADPSIAERFAREMSESMQIEVLAERDLAKAVSGADLCVTCTPASKFFIRKEFVKPGAFIAAVGADSETKQEIDPALIASCKLITDSTEQCAVIGELHHALEMNLLDRQQVHAELGQVIAGKKSGRATEDEIIVFDSTGTGLQDVAAAAIVYEKAMKKGMGRAVDFGR